jgi:metal-sulfur cluster biosynthetic enzyme
LAAAATTADSLWRVLLMMATFRGRLRRVIVVDADAARKALRQVKDPELDLNIVDLGLVYDIEVEEGNVNVKMTLTSPGCPVGPQIMGDADRVIRMLDGVKDVKVELVWEPFWTPERIDPKLRSFLGH